MKMDNIIIWSNTLVWFRGETVLSNHDNGLKLSFSLHEEKYLLIWSSSDYILYKDRNMTTNLCGNVFVRHSFLLSITILKRCWSSTQSLTHRLTQPWASSFHLLVKESPHQSNPKPKPWWRKVCLLWGGKTSPWVNRVVVLLRYSLCWSSTMGLDIYFKSPAHVDIFPRPSLRQGWPENIKWCLHTFLKVRMSP